MTHSIESLLTLMAQLRDKQNGCPWDIKQTFDSIAPHTIEEAYEVVDAIHKKDMNHLKEELGDLLLQVVFHSELAKEEALFTFDDVVEAIVQKLIHRHPHLFGNHTIETIEEQEKLWEQIKAEEKKQKKAENQSLLAEIASNLPPLVRAKKIQKKAASVGFQWKDIADVFAKLDEEIEELKQEIASSDQDRITDEIGDLFFVLCNLCTFLKVDPEMALLRTIQKFERRFHYIEAALQQKGSSTHASNLEEMDRLWDEAKTKGI